MSVNKSKVALMLAEPRSALVGHVLLQLKQTNPDLFDDVLLFYIDEYAESDKRIFESLANCKFVKCDSPLPDTLFSLEKFSHFSKLVCARYALFNLIDTYDVVVWLDTDILIQGDISGLIQLADESGFAILSEDPTNKSSFSSDTIRSNYFHDLPGYDMSSYLYCTGTIVVSNKLKKNADYEKWCYEKTVEWAQNLNLIDQGVINALIQEFNISVVPINGSRYATFPYYGRDCSQAKYIHAWGSNKFWNDWYLYTRFPKWCEHYNKWIELGGSPLAGFSAYPSVSVVVPIYKPNTEWLIESIKSLVNQKKSSWERFSDFEILLIIEPYDIDIIRETIVAFDDPRIRILFNDERKGIAASLNRGLHEARGKYIARIDDDDLANEYRLFKQQEYLEQFTYVHMCVTDFLYFGDMDEGRKIFEGNMAKAWSVLTCPFDHPTIMFRREFFIDNDLFYDEKRRFTEDWELWLRAFDKGMIVGCIHEELTYHRWHNGSAGQTNQTSEMMNQLVQANMVKLGVPVNDDFAWALRPWNGQLSAEHYGYVKDIFEKAIEANARLGYYDSACLRHAFDLRLAEAKTGALPEIIVRRKKNTASITFPDSRRSGKFRSFIRRLIKRVLYPLWNPIRWRLIDPIKRIEQIVDELRGLPIAIEQYQAQLHEFCASTDARIVQAEERIAEAASARIRQSEENINASTDAHIAQVEERITEAASARIWQAEEHVNASTNARIAQAEAQIAKATSVKTDDIHRHIDFTYRDIMIVLDRLFHFAIKKNIRLDTDFPVAYESLDHLFPHGTVRDNTRYPRFIAKCEKIFSLKTHLSILDLGCSGGGMVLDALLRGHYALGLEGSNVSKIQQRAEWRLLPDNLKTCDITKPFTVYNNDCGNVCKFDVITAWEVLEHIKEDDLPMLLDNISRHLSDDGIFVASIANWADIDPVTGNNWHVNMRPYTWWKDSFQKSGFEIHTNIIDTADLARGGYNPPLCYAAPYNSFDKEKNFHIVVKKI